MKKKKHNYFLYTIILVVICFNLIDMTVTQVLLKETDKYEEANPIARHFFNFHELGFLFALFVNFILISSLFIFIDKAHIYLAKKLDGVDCSTEKKNKTLVMCALIFISLQTVAIVNNIILLIRY